MGIWHGLPQLLDSVRIWEAQYQWEWMYHEVSHEHHLAPAENHSWEYILQMLSRSYEIQVHWCYFGAVVDTPFHVERLNPSLAYRMCIDVSLNLRRSLIANEIPTSWLWNFGRDQFWIFRCQLLFREKLTYWRDWTVVTTQFIFKSPMSKDIKWPLT